MKLHRGVKARSDAQITSTRNQKCRGTDNRYRRCTERYKREAIRNHRNSEYSTSRRTSPAAGDDRGNDDCARTETARQEAVGAIANAIDISGKDNQEVEQWSAEHPKREHNDQTGDDPRHGAHIPHRSSHLSEWTRLADLCRTYQRRNVQDQMHALR